MHEMSHHHIIIVIVYMHVLYIFLLRLGSTGAYVMSNQQNEKYHFWTLRVRRNPILCDLFLFKLMLNFGLDISFQLLLLS